MPEEEKPPKEEKLQIRIDVELARRVRKKALRYGGLSAVVRALLRAWLAHDDLIAWDDIAVENLRAAKKKKSG